MTMFIDNTRNISNPQKRKTIITGLLGSVGNEAAHIIKVENDDGSCVNSWNYVEFIGYSQYGDMFKVWDTNINECVLVFGKKGEEDYGPSVSL